MQGLALCLSCSKALVLDIWKIEQWYWMKMAVNNSALQLKATRHGQEAAEGNPAPLQGRKKHRYSPHFFDLAVTNKDDTEVNQTKVNKENP